MGDETYPDGLLDGRILRAMMEDGLIGPPSEVEMWRQEYSVDVKVEIVGELKVERHVHYERRAEIRQALESVEGVEVEPQDEETLVLYSV